MPNHISALPPMLYNHHIVQKNIGHISPIAKLKEWQKTNPELFVKKVYNQSRPYTYKMKENDKNYIKIDRFAPSSKTCTHYIYQELKLSDRVFTCLSCGQSEDRDLAASINIKRFGLQQYSEQAGIVCNVK